MDCAAWVDPDEGEAVARGGVLAGEDFVVADEEVVGAVEAGLDLDPERGAVRLVRQDVEAGVVVGLLLRAASEAAFGGEDGVDAPPFDLAGFDGVTEGFVRGDLV